MSVINLLAGSLTPTKSQVISVIFFRFILGLEWSPVDVRLCEAFVNIP